MTRFSIFLLSTHKPIARLLTAFYWKDGNFAFEVERVANKIMKLERIQKTTLYLTQATIAIIGTLIFVVLMMVFG